MNDMFKVLMRVVSAGLLAVASGAVLAAMDFVNALQVDVTSPQGAAAMVLVGLVKLGLDYVLSKIPKPA